jgi:hypothetical protein
LSEKVSEKVSEKASLDVALDIDATLKVADKVADLLDANIKEPFERYLVARLISILYEEAWNFSLDPEFEGKVRKIAKRSQKNEDGD